MKRLTIREWENAQTAILHAEADWECWEHDGDDAAKDLRHGIDVLLRLINEHKPARLGKNKGDIA